MAAGYWIFHADIADRQAFTAYMSATAAAFAKYGARLIVRGGNQEIVEGTARSRHGGDRIQGLRNRARLLSVAGISDCADSPRGREHLRLVSSRAMTGRNRAESEFAMSDMRLVVTGAAGRMGRTLIKAIHETPGVTLDRRARAAGLAGAR